MRAWLAATLAVVACGKGSTPSGNGSATEAPVAAAPAIATPNGWGSAWATIANPATIDQLGCTYASDASAVAMKLQPPGGSDAVSLPHELGQLVRLEELCVEHGGLTELPVELIALAHLSKLDVANNRLRALPDLRKLPITTLVVGGNPDLDLAHVAWPATLAHLSIAKSKLAALPAHLEALPALVDLDVPDNQLTEVPEALWSAPALKNLDLSRNPIHRLPGIEKAKALQSLAVVGVPLDPDEIDRLQALGKTIELIGLGNPQSLEEALKDPTHAYRVLVTHRDTPALTKLPAAIGTLVNLRELVIDDERLTSLPPEIGKLVHLRLLSVQGNALAALPPALFTLPALQVLRLDDNAITVLPDDIAKLAELRELSIARNALTALPAALGSLAKLEILDADANQLASVPAALANARALRELFLWNNRLTSLPPNVGDAVAIFDVRMNPLRDISEHGRMLAPMITYDEDTGPALPYRVTKPLSLDDRTRVAAIGADDLATFMERTSDKLRTLKLGEPGRSTGEAIVRLHKLPDDLAQLVNLGELDVSDTELRGLPRWLRDLKYLRRLTVTGCAALTPPPWLAYQLTATTVVDDCHESAGALAELQPLLQFKLGKTPAAIVAERHCPSHDAGATWQLALETEGDSRALATLDDHGVLKANNQPTLTLATPDLDWRSAVTWKQPGASLAIAVTTATGPASLEIDVK